jgi:hypothetical protein
MRVVALTLAALALTGVAVGTAGAGAATKPQLVSGLRGVVMRGPTEPVCYANETCDEPAAGVVLQFRRDGLLVARVKTGEAGAYRVILRPGSYVVRTAAATGIGRRLSPTQVRVTPGRVARVDFHIDTGIQ